MNKPTLPDRIQSSGLDAAQLFGETFDLVCVHLPSIHNNVVSVVHLLLFRGPSATLFTKGMRVNGGSCCSPSNQWNMIVVTCTLAIQLLNDVSAAAHEARRLLHQSLLTTFVVDVCLHREPTHVGLCQLH